MKALRFIALAAILAALLILPATNRTVYSVFQEQELAADQANVAASEDATYKSGDTDVDLEGVAEDDTTTYSFSAKEDPTDAATETQTAELKCRQPPIQQAKANGFDDVTNDLIDQGKPPEDCVDPVPGTFLQDKAIFEEVDEIGDGLGPVYNAQACRECHQNPVTGAISQITELRAGHTTSSTFFDAPGGSLINNRGIPTPNYADAHKSAKVQERVPPLFTAPIISGPVLDQEQPTRTFRTSLNTLGDGFVEAIANGTLVALSNHQSVQTGGQVHGLVIKVPVLEAGSKKRIGRFGWKDQHASLLSFSGDAYLNEIGITNFLVRKENTSLGRFVGFGTIFDTVPDNTPCDAHPFVLCGGHRGRREGVRRVYAGNPSSTSGPRHSE
jgi:hypothetical protein